MKKILAALLVASFGAGLMAYEQLVYDYKASIKRLDATFTSKAVKGSKAKKVAQSFKVASDTISGYVILPACQECAGGVDVNMFDAVQGFKYAVNENDARGYFVRKGDKLSKANKFFSTVKVWEEGTGIAKENFKNRHEKDNIPYVLKSPVFGSAALFGAYQLLPEKAPQTSKKAANKAWMKLNYMLPIDAANIDPTKVLSNTGYDVKRDGPLYLGFLGLANYGVENYATGAEKNGKAEMWYNASVYHTGFGTASEISSRSADGWCAPGSETHCIIIKTMTGTLVGYPNYQGVCFQTPMWDVCSDETVNDGVIYGTWTLKINNTMTEKYAADGQKAILTKLGADASRIIYTNTNDPDIDAFDGDNTIVHKSTVLDPAHVNYKNNNVLPAYDAAAAKDVVK